MNSVDHHILGGGRRCFIVTQGDRVAGLLTLHCKETPRSDWPTVTAVQMKRLQSDAELWTALEEMAADGVNQLPVMMDGQMLGLLSRDSIIGFLRARRELNVCAIPCGRKDVIATV